MIEYGCVPHTHTHNKTKEQKSREKCVCLCVCLIFLAFYIPHSSVVVPLVGLTGNFYLFVRATQHLHSMALSAPLIIIIKFSILFLPHSTCNACLFSPLVCVVLLIF